MSLLSEKIARAIADSGMTARQVAAKIGYHESTVSLWISGERVPRVKALQKLADALGMEMAEFWQGAEAVPATAEQSAMVDEMANLTVEQQQALVAIARTMRKT